MKFMGLILMCAASSMALLLPAMGVVKFPVLNQATIQGLIDETQGTTANIAENPDPQTSAGMLVAAQISGAPNTPEATESKGSIKTDYLGKIPVTQIGSQRVGLGVWLLLLPTILLGLFMWTFGSSPKSSK